MGSEGRQPAGSRLKASRHGLVTRGKRNIMGGSTLPSSSGPGHRPLTSGTGVRTPLGAPPSGSIEIRLQIPSAPDSCLHGQHLHACWRAIQRPDSLSRKRRAGSRRQRRVKTKQSTMYIACSRWSPGPPRIHPAHLGLVSVLLGEILGIPAETVILHIIQGGRAQSPGDIPCWCRRGTIRIYRFMAGVFAERDFHRSALDRDAYLVASEHRCHFPLDGHRIFHLQQRLRNTVRLLGDGGRCQQAQEHQR